MPARVRAPPTLPRLDRPPLLSAVVFVAQAPHGWRAPPLSPPLTCRALSRVARRGGTHHTGAADARQYLAFSCSVGRAGLARGGVAASCGCVPALVVAGWIERSRHQAAATARAPRCSCLSGLATYHPAAGTPTTEIIPPDGASEARVQYCHGHPPGASSSHNHVHINSAHSTQRPGHPPHPCSCHGGDRGRHWREGGRRGEGWQSPRSRDRPLCVGRGGRHSRIVIASPSLRRHGRRFDGRRRGWPAPGREPLPPPQGSNAAAAVAVAAATCTAAATAAYSSASSASPAGGKRSAGHCPSPPPSPPPLSPPPPPAAATAVKCRCVGDEPRDGKPLCRGRHRRADGGHGGFRHTRWSRQPPAVGRSLSAPAAATQRPPPHRRQPPARSAAPPSRPPSPPARARGRARRGRQRPAQRCGGCPQSPTQHRGVWTAP